MQMLSPWIEDEAGHAIRVREGTDALDVKNRIVQVLDGIPSVRVRADNGEHADWLNWAQGDACLNTMNNKSWCDRMAKSFHYALPEEGAYVIQYDDGAFNFGDEGTDVNGFFAMLSEASRYTELEVAEEKLRDLLYPDGTGARIVRIRDLDVSNLAAPFAPEKVAA